MSSREDQNDIVSDGDKGRYCVPLDLIETGDDPVPCGDGRLVRMDVPVFGFDLDGEPTAFGVQVIEYNPRAPFEEIWRRFAAACGVDDPYLPSHPDPTPPTADDPEGPSAA